MREYALGCQTQAFEPGLLRESFRFATMGQLLYDLASPHEALAKPLEAVKQDLSGLGFQVLGRAAQDGFRISLTGQSKH